MSTIDRETQRTVPRTSFSTSVSTGGAKNVDLSAFIGGYVWLASDGGHRMVSDSAAASLPTAGAAALTGALPWPANDPRRFLVARDTAHVAIFSDAGCEFYWARAEPPG